MTRHPLLPARPREGGFALLIIFLMAAAVAFTMYQELPRAAFESARDKEQLLMDRGNQYKRAIQVYYAVNKRYPADLKDLESTNDKRFLRRRYKDPMTGEDQWRLIHTNGSFLTDSLVQKPPAQNANSGLPGAGQTPGGGPLGANNMNTAPAANTPNNANNPANNANDPAFAVTAPAAQNSAAQRRPSDRGFPGGGPGLPPGSSSPLNPNQAPPNPFGPNPATFNPGDPSTWPAITLAPPTTQPGQSQQPAPGQRPPNAQIIGGGQPINGSQPSGNQNFPGQPPFGQPVQPAGGSILGQLPGTGGVYPQPVSPINPNPLGQNSPNPGSPQSPPQMNLNQDGLVSLPVNTPGFQPAQPTTGGPPFNGGQQSNSGQQFNNGQSLNGAPPFTPQSPAPFQRPAGGGQPNTANPGNSNAALDAINNQLFRPNQAAGANGPVGSPGIAGVASKFEGPSIKAYRERTKFQEWEFVYEPGANQLGQAGAPAQNPQMNTNGQNQNGLGQNGAGQTPGQSPPGASQPNPFAQPNPFSQPNPFGPPSSPR